MTIIDTNILYYKHKDSKYKIDLKNNYITSINALEFLKNIEKKHSNRAKYYIPFFKNSLHEIFLIKNKNHKNRPFNRRFSDAIIFDFKGDYENYILYNNLSVTDVINNKKQPLFNSSIHFFSKENYKDIKEKFNFLVENNLNCLSIETKDIELGYILLELFNKNHSIKEDFRNTWNDILILSKSINTKSKLITKDKLLNKFASELFNAKLILLDNDDIEIDFSRNEIIENDYTKFESKGYINRGWQYKIINKK